MKDSRGGSIGTAPTDPAKPVAGGETTSASTVPFAPKPETATATAPAVTEEDDGLPAGTRLGKYQIVGRLGSGGMGAVYEAIHTGISKPVALKTLSARLASQPRAQTRFLREAAAASRLDHPNVVDVIDFGADAGVNYLVMELLRGEDLSQLLARDRESGLPIERVADTMLAVCAGVFAAHQAGVIHRDLKPQNIFLARTPLGDVVPKVLDFGISKLLDDEMSKSLTGTGAVIGTTPYLSPEQVSGGDIGARSDQYTMGVILYECVTGKRPHAGEVIYVMMRNIAEGRFPRPRELRPDLPLGFEEVILRAMSRAPDHRYESVHSLGRAMLSFATPKQRMIWSDYYERDKPSTSEVPLGSQSARIARSDPQATCLLPPDHPESLAPTRTRAQPQAPTPAAVAATALPSAVLAIETGGVPIVAKRNGVVLALVALMALVALGAWVALRGRDAAAPAASGAATAMPPRTSTLGAPPPAALEPVPPVQPPPAMSAPVTVVEDVPAADPAPKAARDKDAKPALRTKRRPSSGANASSKPTAAPILD